MNIAMFGLTDLYGGVENFIVNTYRQLKSTENKFYFITSYENIKYMDFIEKDDSIICYTSRRKNAFKSYSDLYNFFSTTKIDIVWYNTCSLSDISPLIIAKRFNVKKIILHSHNGDNMGGFFTKVMHNVNKIIVDRYVTDYFSCSPKATQWMFNKKKYKEVVYINNAIDTDLFLFNQDKQRELKKRYGVEDCLVIGHVGRFHTQKNHLFLIDVFLEFKKLNFESKLFLCGTGDLMTEVKNKVNSLNLSDSVIFLGQVQNMSEIYQMFDCFLFPSLYEGLPFSLIEAQAAGLKCLVSDSISESVNLTGLIEFESLQCSAAEWASKLNELDKTRINTSLELKKAGYDLKCNQEKIKKLLKIGKKY